MTRIFALLAALMLLAGLASIAAAQDDNAQRNEANSDSSQDVVINQNCSAGAVCNANVGAPEPATQVQANSAAEAEPEYPGNCPEGRAWDYHFNRCTAIQADRERKAERLGYAIALLGLMLVGGAVFLRWLGGGSDKYSGGYY